MLIKIKQDSKTIIIYNLHFILVEILLKRPSDGELWSWHPTKTSHSGAGVSFFYQI